MGVKIKRGDPQHSRAGLSIVIPQHPSQLAVIDVELDRVRRSYIQNAIKSLPQGGELTEIDLAFLAEETRISQIKVQGIINELTGKTG